MLSIYFQWNPSHGPAAVAVETDGDEFRHRLVHRLKLSPAQLFGGHSLCRAVAANHVSQQSDINTTQQTTQLKATQPNLTKTKC